MGKKDDDEELQAPEEITEEQIHEAERDLVQGLMAHVASHQVIISKERYEMLLKMEHTCQDMAESVGRFFKTNDREAKAEVMQINPPAIRRGAARQLLILTAGNERRACLPFSRAAVWIAGLYGVLFILQYENAH